MSDIQEAWKREQGKVLIYREQDVQPYLDANKRMQAEQVGGWRRAGKGTRRMVADIPNIVVEMWLKQGFNMFSASERELRKKLDEPEWAYLKTIPGRLGQRSRHI
jgi:hypothetical protein